MRKFPAKGTPEFDNIKTRYENGESLRALAPELNMTPAGLKNALNQYGIKRKVISSEVMEPKETIINLPPVQLKRYKPVKKTRRGDPEVAVLNLGDHHAGEYTPTYNPDTYKQRMDTLYKSVMVIIELHRNMYPINDLVINLLGDMVHGENPYQGATPGTIKQGALEQIHEIALPELLNFIFSLKQEFQSIKIYTVKGNHGRYSPIAPKTSNWDNALYKAMKPLVQRQGIEMTISDEFCLLYKIHQWKFFVFHGDQIRAHQGVPYFALDRAIKSWHMTFGGFDYAILGHFHKDDFMRISSTTKAFINGSLVSDDPFALEVVKTSTIPSQWLFGVHEKRGITWTYSLIVDPEFFKKVSE